MDSGSEIPWKDEEFAAAGRDLATGGLADLPRDLLPQRARKGCWIAIASILVFAGLDLLGPPQALLTLYAIKIASLAILAGVLVFLRRQRSATQVILAGLTAFAAAAWCSAISSSVVGDASTTVNLCIALAFGVAAMVPWGLAGQLAAAAIALSASLFNAWVVAPSVFGDHYPLGALLVSLAVSVYIAAQVDRQRRALAEENQERRLAEERLEAAMAEMQDLWNNTPCGYHSLDGDGRFVRVNDTELSWLGYTREELIGKLRLADVVTAEGRRVFEETFPVLKERGWERDLEVDLLCKDGSTFPVLLSSSAMVDVDGRFVMSRTTTVDNGPRKQFERQKADFFSMVAHDIRNPVSTMLGGLELLRESTSIDDETRNLVNIVGRSATLLSSLVNDYLDYAKIEAGQLKLVRQTLSVPAFLTQICDDVRYEAERRGVELEVDCDADVHEIHADSMALQRIVSNLLGNALKFTPAGGHIRVRVARDDRHLVFSVADDGPGISAEDVPALFARYRQTETGRRVVGTGLGLYVVKSLVEAHGGSVEVESEVGRGTTFIVRLPQADADSKAA